MQASTSTGMDTEMTKTVSAPIPMNGEQTLCRDHEQSVEGDPCLNTRLNGFMPTVPKRLVLSEHFLVIRVVRVLLLASFGCFFKAAKQKCSQHQGMNIRSSSKSDSADLSQNKCSQSFLSKFLRKERGLTYTRLKEK